MVDSMIRPRDVATNLALLIHRIHFQVDDYPLAKDMVTGCDSTVYPSICSGMDPDITGETFECLEAIIRLDDNDGPPTPPWEDSEKDEDDMMESE